VSIILKLKSNIVHNFGKNYHDLIPMTYSK